MEMQYQRACVPLSVQPLWKYKIYEEEKIEIENESS